VETVGTCPKINVFHRRPTVRVHFCCVSQSVLQSSGRYSDAVVQTAMSHQLAVSSILADAGFQQFVDRSTEEPRLPELASVSAPSGPLFDTKLVALTFEVTKLTSRAEAAEETAAKLAREVDSLRAQLVTVRSDSDAQISSSAVQLNTTIEGLQSKLAAAEAVISSNRASSEKIAAIQADAESTKRQLMSLRIDHDEANNKLRSAETQLAAASAKLQSLTSAKSDLESRLSTAEQQCKR
jgi:hypothetical protein